MGPLLGTQTNLLFHSSYESSTKFIIGLNNHVLIAFFSKVFEQIVTISLNGVDGNPLIKVDNLNGWFGCAQGIPQLCN